MSDDSSAVFAFVLMVLIVGLLAAYNGIGFGPSPMTPQSKVIWFGEKPKVQVAEKLCIPNCSPCPSPQCSTAR